MKKRESTIPRCTASRVGEDAARFTPALREHNSPCLRKASQRRRPLGGWALIDESELAKWL